jgi:FKBP-type peptidyl-prolyl cis-trans isomerase
MWKNLWPLYLIIAVALMTPACSENKAGGSGKLVKLPSGLAYQEIEVGGGAEAKPGDTVSVAYTGRLSANLKQFGTTQGKEPYSFTLGKDEVIKGWDEGVTGMRVGGKRKLLIPAELGYGKKGKGKDIPPNAALELDVELVNVEK